MKVKQIRIAAGRTVPHPLYGYGNIRHYDEMIVELEEGDDPDEIRDQLRKQIESRVESHIADVKDSIEDLEAHARKSTRIKQLESELNKKQKEIDELRKDFDGDRPLLS